MDIRKSSHCAIHLNHEDGRSATIDYTGGVVTFYGELPVDDAAKIFFNAVGGILFDTYKNSIEEKKNG